MATSLLALLTRPIGRTRPFSWRRTVVVSLLVAGAATAVIGVAGPRVTRRGVAARLATMLVPVPQELPRRLGQLDVLAAWRAAPDPAVTPAEAGAALRALGFAPGDLGHRWLQGADTLVGAGLRALADSNPTGLAPRRWCGELPARAAALSQAQAAWLDAAAHDASAPLFRRFARAASADLLGARYVLPAADAAPLAFQQLPQPRLRAVQHAVAMACARAALALRRGDAAGAEAEVREAIAASVLLARESPDLTGAIVGVAAAGALGDALATTLEARGRGADAARLRAALDAAPPVAYPATLAGRAPSAHALVEALPAAAARRDLPRGLRWEWFRTALTYRHAAYCGHVEERDAAYAAWLAAVRAGLVERESDARLFDWMTAARPVRGAECLGRAAG